MEQPRWLDHEKDDPRSLSIYHVVNRVVDRFFAFGDEKKEKFRMFMRMVEGFSGCQVLSSCVIVQSLSHSARGGSDDSGGEVAR